jgi:hypothetical protein
MSNTSNYYSSSRSMKKPPLPFGLSSLTRSNSTTVNRSALNDILNPSHAYTSATSSAAASTTSGSSRSHHHRTSSTTLSHAIEIPDASTPYYHHSRTPSSSSSILYGTMSSATAPIAPTSAATVGSSSRKLSESFRLKSCGQSAPHQSFLLPRKDSIKSSVSGNATPAGGHHNYTESDFSNLKLKSRLDRQMSVNSALLKSSYLAAIHNNSSNSSSSNKSSTLNYNLHETTTAAATTKADSNLQAPGSQSLPRKKKKFASTLSSSASFLQRKRHSIESLIGFCKMNIEFTKFQLSKISTNYMF